MCPVIQILFIAGLLKLGELHIFAERETSFVNRGNVVTEDG